MKTIYYRFMQSWQATPEWKRSVLVTAFLLLALLPWTDGIPAFRRMAFVMPTAWIASWFMSAACVPTSQGYMLITSATPVHVILACSGATFFALLASLLAGQTLASRRPKLLGLAIALGMAYGTAIAANSARVVFTWFADRWAEHMLPPQFIAAAHMGAGIMVFLVFLVLTWILFLKAINNE
ncbi:MAG: archaeosortase/exosortase family protein [Kiritimatiellae bacterium]|nr:archaeosortase/exosortase family protein [Kiritimatiellia bacterium]